MVEEPYADRWPEGTIFTIGHSTHPIDAFTTLLRQVAVVLLVDVRTVPRSRANPQFNSDALAQSLRRAHISYRHMAALGGLRHRPRGAAPSPNGLWRNASFRNFADYAASDAFARGLAELRAAAHDHRPAIMCAEAVWWRCHRRIIADYLLAAKVPVAHIMGLGKIEPATLTPGAVVRADGIVLYPAPEGGQALPFLTP